MSAAEEAAAGLGVTLAAELVQKGYGTPELAEDVQAVAAVEEAEQPTAAVAEPPQQAAAEAPAVELPDFSYVEFDDDEDDEPAVAAVADDDEDDVFEGEYEDPDALKARLAKTQKRLAHLEQETLKSKHAAWRAKYKSLYPLANVAEIQAASRRAFEKAAIRSHNENYKLLEPHIEKLKAAAGQIGDTALAEAKENAKVAWGKPTAGPGVEPVEASANQAELSAARKSGDLTKVIGVLLRRAGVENK